jgi:hypothetical protein
MVKGILADVNSEGHVRALLRALQEETRQEYWTFLKLTVPHFADLGLQQRDPDRLIWLKCQQEQLVLITANRNDDGPDSLEATIRTLGTADSLPVLTLADADRILHERSYAERVADKVLTYLFDIDHFRGAGRLYVP